MPFSEDDVSEEHDRASGTHAGSSEDMPSRDTPVEDILSDLLETVRLRAAVFFLWEPGWPYSITVPDGSLFAPALAGGADQLASYHIVIDGPCWGAVAGEEPVRLERGDILLVPRGDAYVIASEPQQPAPGDGREVREVLRMLAAGELPPVVRNGGPGPEGNRLVCGFLGCDMRPFNPLLGTLPRMLRVPTTLDASDPIATLVDFATAETRRSDGGTRCVLLRVSELMFVEVLRRHLRAQGTQGTGWLQGLRDPLVGRALIAMHRGVERPWTLDGLAGEIGTSRSTLAERFTELVGEPPMQYLTRWRMQVAARSLADGHRKVYAVARDVGYESEAAFSRAFKRVVGVTPARWRTERSAVAGGDGARPVVARSSG